MIDMIREKVQMNIGNCVEVIHNEGRNKIYRYNGKLIEVYPNIFIILNNNRKLSFSYSDVLTNTVKISFNM